MSKDMKRVTLVDTRAGQAEIVLKDIVVPKKLFRRMSFGAPVLDEIIGGQELPGLMPGATYLFTGDPGAGKSTLSLQLADLLQSKAGRNVRYNVGEENRYMVKMRADRIGLVQEFTLTQIEDVDKLIRDCKDKGIEVLFVDSIQSMTDGDLRGGERLKSIVKKLVRFSQDNDVATFLIGHITKGRGFAGPQEIVHDVDGHAHLKINFETGGRIFDLKKNRYGPAGIPYEFTISASGLDFQQVAIADTENAPGVGVSKASERRGEITTLIKDKLKAGDQVSGYCFERFDVDCSGGFWRGMLSRAVKELKAEGYDIGEVKSGPSGKNRAHAFVRSAPKAPEPAPKKEE